MTKENNNYLKPVLTAASIDFFFHRQAIFQALIVQLQSFNGRFLDIGCGDKPYKPLLISPQSKVKNYIGLDIVSDIYTTPDIFWNGQIIPMKDASIDSCMATEVLEHCFSPQKILEEIFRVLQPGGLFFFTVPFFWPLHDVPRDEFRYTPFSLRRLLQSAGFIDITLSAMGGWDASLAQMIGLWAIRRPMGSIKRILVSRMALPLIRLLIVNDRLPSDFYENLMVTGISGTAKKPG